MAFLPFLGSLIGPAIGSLFTKGANPLSGAGGFDAASSAYLTGLAADQINSMNSSQKLSHDSLAFNANIERNATQFQEEHTLETIYVSVGQADKKVIDQLSQAVSQG